MNINPSDMDVRQGYSPAEIVAAAAPAGTASQNSQEGASAQQVEADPRSQAAAAAADRQIALAAAEKLSKQLENNDTTLKIRLLDNTQSGVQVEIVDTSSEKVLRKIPQDELIKLSASIKKMTGVFVNQST
ncbi:MAG: flagellar protein FlaG [Humidesulfovibrio sp.]